MPGPPRNPPRVACSVCDKGGMLTIWQVAFVEPDQMMHAFTLRTQTGATYGLGRISHRAPGTTSYIYDSTAGAGTRVYIVDTGIRTTHTVSPFAPSRLHNTKSNDSNSGAEQSLVQTSSQVKQQQMGKATAPTALAL
jgi:hypothetical protein